ncbi:unnamed protein product [Rotaria socialis]|uniref:Uncharacterized protein n=1 Tax=Rotaria socialis TaxID=392032 RepID=A0A820F2F6_9BILA|nr:unnamed protein product [Rotaria socialis]CAF3214375.1 unnamed protein product [Rotaria socialis]CAF3328791.1 unnamed protein product [Rotaria socialis]CAF3365618.1 unnamed protein product [Rotaria socialis]CAF3676052.1 unnamed protein product [Rotaria socialis]
MVHVTATTLHLHYDLEKPGYHGYDRRHFPEKHRYAFSECSAKPRGRLYISSPRSNPDDEWRPHGRHVEPMYTDIGPDWQSRIRYIPSPHNSDTKPTLPVGLIEKNLHFVRPYPQNWQRSANEWMYFADESINQNSSKRNHFDNIHLRSLEDLGDQNMSMVQIGHKKKVLDIRNGLKKKSEGDKNYRTVEQSPEFHKYGTTLPVVDFGHEKKRQGNARNFVPMRNDRIHIIDEREFTQKERQQEKENIIDEVVQLDNWKPAERVKSAFKVFDLDPNDKYGGKYRPRIR